MSECGYWTGCRPYYRRALGQTGTVAVYFRDVTGRKMGRIVLSGAAHTLFKAGQSYTVEVAPHAASGEL
jgi:hypothetical protein